MRLIRPPEVYARTGLGRSRVYEEIARGEFPKPVRIGERAVAFVEAEVEDWIKARIAAREVA